MSDQISVMALAERELHERAKAVKPDQTLKPTRFWVGILYHDKKVTDAFEEADFLWIKAHGKITVQTIREQYLSKSPIDIALKLDGGFPLKESKLADLNLYNDNIVIFRAIEAGSFEMSELFHRHEQRSRKPLSPINSQMRAKPVKVEAQQYYGAGKPIQVMMPGQYGHLSQKPLEPCLNRQAAAPIKAEPQELNFQPGVLMQRNQMPAHNNNIGAVYPPVISGHHNPYDHPNYPTQAGEERHNVEKSFTNNLPRDFDGMQARQEVPIKHENAEEEIEQFQPIHLPKLLSETDPTVLEKGFTNGLELLENLQSPLKQHSDVVDAQQWLERIRTIQSQAKRSRTVIGVVGNTGAGKSSVINALLDEERLVPTNCMRACTAVVTELSYNDVEITDKNEDKKYCAEIEFIKAADWERELRILFEDLIDSNGNISREASNADSDAGIAFAKIKAVYPKKSREDLASSSVTELMANLAVKRVLGTTVDLKSAYPDRFYSLLQSYVDSKEKVNGKKKERFMEYWPLIKVVRIYTKADALSTGAVLVDLPGVHDSNAARAAVAEGYLKQCSGLWIVAPITRAVDDKAAKSLLGDSFKRQLKYDGTYNNVTFICSKTDDISIQEATETLDLEEEMADYFKRLDELSEETSRIKGAVRSLREKKETMDDLMTELSDKEEMWEALKEKCDDGETVYAPHTEGKQKKRKRDSDVSAPSKRRRRYSTASDDYIVEGSERGNDSRGSDVDTSATEDGEEEEDGDNEDDNENREPLAPRTILKEIDDIRKLKKEARREKASLDQPIRDLQAKLKEVKREEHEVEAKVSARCISGRNSYSKVAIRQDFAAGIKELDQENAAEADEANFNPDEDLRDYDEVERSLPVFCVSSRAYQRLSGRFKKEKDVPGFIDVAETEVPRLQAHCKKLTESGRAMTCRRFLNSLSQLLNSLSLWAASYGARSEVLHAKRGPGVERLKKKLGDLEDSLYAVIRRCVSDVKEMLQDNIYLKYDKAVRVAGEKALPTAISWGAPVDRTNVGAGGLYWATYKAICRRDGIFTNARGSYDFNVQLAEPMIKLLSSGWEKAFARRLPQILNGFRQGSSSLLAAFHNDVEDQARETEVSMPGLMMLSQQLNVYAANLSDLSGTVNEKVNATQREASREFTPIIVAAMEAAYKFCTQEQGTGCFARMKDFMTKHVEHERDSMFVRATEHVTGILAQMCREIEEHMTNQVDEVLCSMRKDYMSVIAAGPNESSAGKENPVMVLRKEILEILKVADERFAVVEDGNGGDSGKGEGEAADEERKGQGDVDVDMDVEGKQARCESVPECDTRAGDEEL